MQLVYENPYGNETVKCVKCEIYLKGRFFHCPTCIENVENIKKQGNDKNWQNCDYCTNCAASKSIVQPPEDEMMKIEVRCLLSTDDHKMVWVEDPYSTGQCVNCVLCLKTIRTKKCFHCKECAEFADACKKRPDGEIWKKCDFCHKCAIKITDQ